MTVISEKLVGALPRGTDLEVHVRVLEVEGASLVDIREFVVGTETYGRGVLLDKGDVKELGKLLAAARSA